MVAAIKFPKTPRLVSVLREPSVELYRQWKRSMAVVEEKVDGANVGIWFDEAGRMQLQSRGHVLLGGHGERQFAPFHAWAGEHHQFLYEALGSDYVLYGEWCFAKHKAFYDALPDLFLAFDVLDRTANSYLCTSRRDTIFAAARVIGAPRLWSGPFGKAPHFSSLLGPSRLKTPRWRDALVQAAARAGVADPMAETDDSDWMEGVYIRVEDSKVVGRMKLHREGYDKVRSDGWRRRPVIQNGVGAGVRRLEV